MSAEHETRTTARLRWEPLSNGDALGYVTPGQWLYEIGKPSDDADDDELQLMSRLPGQTGHHTQGTDRAELEREAEEMLAEFVTSLNAIFPDGSAGNKVGQDEPRAANRPVLTSRYVFGVLRDAGFTPWGNGEPGFTTGWYMDAITVDHVGADLPVHGPLEGPRAIIADYAQTLFAAGFDTHVTVNTVLVRKRGAAKTATAGKE